MKLRYWFLGVLALLVLVSPVFAATGVQTVDDFNRADSPMSSGWGTASTGDFEWDCNSWNIESLQGRGGGRGNPPGIQPNSGACRSGADWGNTSVTKLTYVLTMGTLCSGGAPYGGCDMSMSFWDNTTGTAALLTTWSILNGGATHSYGTWASPINFGTASNGGMDTWEIEFDNALQKMRITEIGGSSIDSGWFSTENPFAEVTQIAFNMQHPPSTSLSNNGEIWVNDIEMEYYYTPGGGGGNTTPGNNSQSLTGLPSNFDATLEFNTTTGQWAYYWLDLDSTLNLTELEVWVSASNQYFQIGVNTSTAMNGTMFIDTYFQYENSTTRAFTYLTDYNRTFVGGANKIQLLTATHYAPAVINSSVYTIEEPEGVFWAMTIIGSMVLMSAYNPPVAVMMAVAGLFLTSYLGLFAISQGVLMLIGLMAGILVWRLRK